MSRPNDSGRRRVFGLVVIACVTRAASAFASPAYPSGVTAHLGLSYTPACTICHTNDTGGIGTVTRPFGISMRAHGLVSESEPSLFAALDSMAADHTDSVCDGTPDIDDLKAGRDPNVPDGDAGPAGCGDTVIPRYGCGATVAPRSDDETASSIAGWSALIFGGCWANRRRPRTTLRQ